MDVSSRFSYIVAKKYIMSMLRISFSISLSLSLYLCISPRYLQFWTVFWIPHEMASLARRTTREFLVYGARIWYSFTRVLNRFILRGTQRVRQQQQQQQLAAHITWKRRIFHMCYISVWSSVLCVDLFIRYSDVSLSLSLDLSFLSAWLAIWTIYEYNNRN